MKDSYWLLDVLQPTSQCWVSDQCVGCFATEKFPFHSEALLTNDLPKKAKGPSLIACTP